jgi:Metallo-peptidase family M12B Reprolysin-like
VPGARPGWDLTRQQPHHRRRARAARRREHLAWAGGLPDLAALLRAESITLNPSFQSVSFSGTDAEELIEQAKALFGGARPAGTDVVYVLTNKDIVAIGSDAVAGLADCIGGVAFPANAFAVGENFTPDEGALLGLPSLVNRNLTGKVASHEIGHLMGGHHHYANCIQGLLSDPDEFSPCTLMFNDVGLAGLDFSIVNSLVCGATRSCTHGPRAAG